MSYNKELTANLIYDKTNEEKYHYELISNEGFGQIFKQWTRGTDGYRIRIHLSACEKGFEVRVTERTKKFFGLFSGPTKTHKMLIPYQQTIQKEIDEKIKEVKECLKNQK